MNENFELSEKAKAGRREYKRRWNAKNKAKNAQYLNDFYERMFDQYQAEKAEQADPADLADNVSREPFEEAC